MNAVFVDELLRVMTHNRDSLSWRIDENSEIEFFINCNDSFFWGAADAETVTEETLDVLKKSLEDAGEDDFPYLYCARIRNMRPQGAMYKYLDKKNHHLFDSCGPIREPGIGNPLSQD